MKKKKQKGEKALELFMALLDEFGCFFAPGANPRLELVSSLDEVIFLLKNIERNRNLKEEGVGFGSWLLKIENSLSKVRETAGAFLDYMHDEREEVFPHYLVPLSCLMETQRAKQRSATRDRV